MGDPDQSRAFATLIQAVGVMLVAGLLLPLTWATPGRFLRYWACGWAALTAGLFCVIGAAVSPAWHVPLLVGYCQFEYLFGFLLWAGCREFSTGDRLRPAHFLALLPPAAFGLIAPPVLGTVRNLFPFHAAVFGGLFAAALVSTRKYPVRPDTYLTGLWLVRGSLAGLAGLFWHYAAVRGYAVYFSPTGAVPSYLTYASLYDVLLETGLAFGMVILAADRVRQELEATNRRLAAATQELAYAARTDALTGLLNRRAFDELLRDDGGAPMAGSLAMIDLNNLKELNDRHGHAAGDAALQHVARCLRNHFRVTDPLFRTGGDEFVVVMVGCGEADLTGRLGRVDEALSHQRLPGAPGATDLTVAWGVAVFDTAAALTAACGRADAAMYACKRQRKADRPGPAPVAARA